MEERITRIPGITSSGDGRRMIEDGCLLAFVRLPSFQRQHDRRTVIRRAAIIRLAQFNAFVRLFDITRGRATFGN